MRESCCWFTWKKNFFLLFFVVEFFVVVAVCFCFVLCFASYDIRRPYRKTNYYTCVLIIYFPGSGWLSQLAMFQAHLGYKETAHFDSRLLRLGRRWMVFLEAVAVLFQGTLNIHFVSSPEHRKWTTLFCVYDISESTMWSLVKLLMYKTGGCFVL